MNKLDNKDLSIQVTNKVIVWSIISLPLKYLPNTIIFNAKNVDPKKLSGSFI